MFRGERDSITQSVHEAKAIQATDLLRIERNPSLRSHEKQFIHALMRYTTLQPATKSCDPYISGVSAATSQVLREELQLANLPKKNFFSVLDELNKKNGNIYPHLSVNLGANPLAMVKAGFFGNFGSVVDRALHGRTNCFEFPLVMQTIAKVYYPDEIEEAHVLGFNDSRDPFGGTTMLDTRHFGLFTARQAEEGQLTYTFTPYAGRTRELTKSEAQERRDTADLHDEYGTMNIYKELIRLMQFIEEEH